LVQRLRRERGSALIEFAIVVPFLMLILFGILSFGRFENYSIDEQHLASEAVRYAAVNINPGGGSQTLQQYVLSQASPELQSGSGDVPTAAQVYIYFPSGSSNTVGNPVVACVTAGIHYVPVFGIGNKTIAASATMRLEQLQTGAVWTPNSPPGGSGCP
jgi:Flp pilus assembly protein TadG